MAALAAGAAPKLRELKVYRWAVATEYRWSVNPGLCGFKVIFTYFSLIFYSLPQVLVLERDRQIKRAPLHKQLQLHTLGLAAIFPYLASHAQ